ncbi:hypothetical protein GCM10027570_32090 [Streptomonospora sediminis]
MSGWDISAEGVSSVLSTVGGHVGDEEMTEGLTGEIDTFGNHVQSAGEQAASEPIGLALEEFVDHIRPKLWGMVGRTASAISGCGEATSAYMNGDLEMAAEAQGGAGDISDLDL